MSRRALQQNDPAAFVLPKQQHDPNAAEPMTLAAIAPRVGPGDRRVLRRVLDDIDAAVPLSIRHAADCDRVTAAVAQARRRLA